MLWNNLEGEWSLKSSLVPTVCEVVTEVFGSISDPKVPNMRWVTSESRTLMCSGMITCSSWDTLACESFFDKPATSAWLPSTQGGTTPTPWLTQLGLVDLGFHARCGLTAYMWEEFLNFNILYKRYHYQTWKRAQLSIIECMTKISTRLSDDS